MRKLEPFGEEAVRYVRHEGAGLNNALHMVRRLLRGLAGLLSSEPHGAAQMVDSRVLVFYHDARRNPCMLVVSW